MAISFVTGSANSANNGGVSGGMTVSYSAAIQVGDVLIVKIAGPQNTSWTVTDTQGNSYNSGLHFGNSTNGDMAIYWASARSGSAAGANTVTISSVTGGQDVCVASYRGFSGVPALRITSNAAGNSTTASATVTFGDSAALIVGGANVANSVTGVGGGATNRVTDTFGDNLEDIIVTTAGGPYAPTATQSTGAWIFGIIVLVNPLPSTQPIGGQFRVLLTDPSRSQFVLGSGLLAPSSPPTVAGPLSSTMAAVGALTANLTGAGALSDTMAGVGALSANLTGAGALADTMAAIGGLTATISGTIVDVGPSQILTRVLGFMSPDAPIGSIATLGLGLLSPAPTPTTGVLADTMAATSGLTANLIGSGALSDTMAGVGALTASLTGSGALADTMAAVGALTANLSGAGALNETMASTGALIAGLTGVGALSDTMASSGTFLGSLTGAGALNDTMTGIGTLVGSLTGTGAMTDVMSAVGALSVTGQASNADVGPVQFLRPPTGRFSPWTIWGGRTIGDAAVPPAPSLVDTMAAIAAFSANLTGSGALVDTMAAIGAMSPTLSGSGSLSASESAIGGLAAALSGSGSLTLTASSVSTMSASVTGLGVLIATLLGTGSFIGVVVGDGAAIMTANAIGTFATIAPGSMTATLAAIGGMQASLIVPYGKVLGNTYALTGMLGSTHT